MAFVRRYYAVKKEDFWKAVNDLRVKARIERPEMKVLYPGYPLTEEENDTLMAVCDYREKERRFCQTFWNRKDANKVMDEMIMIAAGWD